MLFGIFCGGNDVLVEEEIIQEASAVVEVIVVETTLKSSSDEVDFFRQKIIKNAELSGVDVKLALAIASCESGFYQGAKNPNSSASGIFQFIRGTWDLSLKQMGMPSDLDVFDGSTNIMVGIWLLKEAGPTPWEASKACWHPKLFVG